MVRLTGLAALADDGNDTLPCPRRMIGVLRRTGGAGAGEVVVSGVVDRSGSRGASGVVDTSSTGSMTGAVDSEERVPKDGVIYDIVVKVGSWDTFRSSERGWTTWARTVRGETMSGG